jgi:hypothetical protein
MHSLSIKSERGNYFFAGTGVLFCGEISGEKTPQFTIYLTAIPLMIMATSTHLTKIHNKGNVLRVLHRNVKHTQQQILGE